MMYVLGQLRSFMLHLVLVYLLPSQLVSLFGYDIVSCQP